MNERWAAVAGRIVDALGVGPEEVVDFTILGATLLVDGRPVVTEGRLAPA